jgi:hypothetical protein
LPACDHAESPLPLPRRPLHWSEIARNEGALDRRYAGRTSALARQAAGTARPRGEPVTTESEDVIMTDQPPAEPRQTTDDLSGLKPGANAVLLIIETPVGVLPVVNLLTLSETLPPIDLEMEATVRIVAAYPTAEAAGIAQREVVAVVAETGTSAWVGSAPMQLPPRQVEQSSATPRHDPCEATAAPTLAQFIEPPANDESLTSYVVCRLDTPLGPTHLALPITIPTAASRRIEPAMDCKLTILATAQGLQSAWAAAADYDNQARWDERRKLN